ncbi:hypothetical protein ABKA04_000950 [Annulohypoxylon sp. FPYF3050]
MSSTYSIKVSIFQTNPNGPLFRIVEKGVWYYASGGEWSTSDTAPILTIVGSGTSGMLRFVSDLSSSSSNRSDANKEAFVITVGVQSDKHWVDIVTNLKNTDTTALLLSQYYADTGNTQADRVNARQAQRSSWEAVNNKGRQISARFTAASGSKDQELIVVIG